MKILHILRTPHEKTALGMAVQRQAKGDDVSLLLLHDAVYTRILEGFQTFACRDDVHARGVEVPGAELVDYPAIVDLVFGHDSVVVW